MTVRRDGRNITDNLGGLAARAKNISGRISQQAFQLAETPSQFAPGSLAASSHSQI
jgi:hypothetical protein